METFHQFFEQELVTPMPDNYGLFAYSFNTSEKLVVSGADICRGDFPQRYSLLFNFQDLGPGQSIVLLDIKNYLTITLDLCRFMVEIRLGDNEECTQDVFNLPLNKIGRSRFAEWQSLAIEFNNDSVILYEDCSDPTLPTTVGPTIVDIPKELCRVPCNDDTTIEILQPPPPEHLGSCRPAPMVHTCLFIILPASGISL